jgi:hypothetical protein
MIDIDELERIIKAGDRYGHVTPGRVLELIAELRQVRAESECMRERLEIDTRHQWDGIACRDVTISEQGRVISALRADLAAANLRGDGNAVDAERYRWLRHEKECIPMSWLLPAGDVLDAAIDAMRAAGEKA